MATGTSRKPVRLPHERTRFPGGLLHVVGVHGLASRPRRVHESAPSLVLQIPQQKFSLNFLLVKGKYDLVDVGREANIEFLAVKWGFPTNPQ